MDSMSKKLLIAWAFGVVAALMLVARWMRMTGNITPEAGGLSAVPASSPASSPTATPELDESTASSGAADKARRAYANVTTSVVSGAKSDFAKLQQKLHKPSGTEPAAR